jgi:ABC-type Fe3+-siderophore transport system permease subunit
MKILSLAAFLLGIFLASLLVGPFALNPLHVSAGGVESLIFWDIRLPRALNAVFVGASLGLGGSLLQTLLRNPLAEPYTLGMSGAASFGAVSAVVFGLSPLGFFMPLLATGACLVTALIMLSLSLRESLGRSRNLILTGVMISLFFGSLVVLILSLMRPEDIQTALFWMMGQIGTERDKDWYEVALVFGGVSLWTAAKTRDLDRLLLGESLSQGLGTSPRSMTFQIVLVVSLLVAACVSVSGLIGFVGLLAPHLTKMWLRTHRHRRFAAGSALIGAILLLVSDVLARLLGGEREIPTGGLVALIGAPMLIYFLHQRSAHDGNS